MKKDFDILELISDDRELKNFSNEKLIGLKQKYPYSSILDLAINRNHFLNTGNLSLLDITEFVSKTDNPGIAFIAAIREEVLEEKSEKKKVKSAKTKVKSEKIKIKSQKSEINKIKSEKDSAKTLKNVKEVDKKRVISDLSQGIASEQLANIYLKQGMLDEAIEMYRRLSLQNSEKSVYFAEILKKLINK